MSTSFVVVAAVLRPGLLKRLDADSGFGVDAMELYERSTLSVLREMVHKEQCAYLREVDDYGNVLDEDWFIAPPIPHSKLTWEKVIKGPIEARYQKALRTARATADARKPLPNGVGVAS